MGIFSALIAGLAGWMMAPSISSFASSIASEKAKRDYAVANERLLAMRGRGTQGE